MKRIVILLLLLAAVPCYASTRPLKEDTAVVVVVGPFVDTAGAAVTAPTIASIDITAYKNDGTAVTITPAASGSSNDMVHVDDGYYSLELTATDTSTAGYLRLSFQISGALIFHEDFDVLPANIYDSKYSTDKLQVDVVQFIGSSITEETTGNIATNYSEFWNNNDNTSHGSYVGNIYSINAKTGYLPSATAGASGGLFIAGTNAATTITTGLTANITGNLSGSVGSLTTNNDKTGYALSAAGVDAVWDEVISGHITSGSFGLAFSDPATLDDIYSGSDLEADIAAISSPQVLQSTTIATLASQTGFTLSAGSADNDAYNGCTAIFVDQSTAVQKAVGVIDDYVGSTKTVTLAGAPAFTIATGDTIHVVSPAGLAEATIVDVGTAATSSEPVEHTSIPNARIFLVKARADGTYGVSGSGRIRMLPGETLWFAVDLKGTQLEPGDLVDSVTAPTVTGAQAANLTVPTYGVFGTLVKFKCVLSGSAATTDTINVKLTITPESGETLFVTVPVTVGS